MITNFVSKGLFFCLMFIPAVLQFWSLNTDIWFILNSGRYVMESGIPHTEPFSMHEGLHFVLEQWLTDVIFWTIFDWFGTIGILSFTFLIAILLLYGYYRLCMMVSNGNEHISFALTYIIGLCVCPLFITTRPQILSMACFLSELLCLEKYTATNKRKWLLPLPFISAVLINAHAALWPMFSILLLPYLAASLLAKMKPSVYSTDFSIAPISFVGISSFIMGFCNPYGWEAMTFVFYSFDPKIHGHIMEIHPAVLHSDYMFFLFTAFLIAMYSRNKMPLQYVFLSIGTALMGFASVRNMFIFYMLGTFPIAIAMKDWKIFYIEGDNLRGIIKFTPNLILNVFLALTVFILAVQYLSDIPELPLVIVFYFSLLFILLFIFLFGYKICNNLFDFRNPLLSIKLWITPLCFIFFYLFTANYTTQVKNEYGESFRPTIDYLLEHKNPSDIVLWTGFNTGAYAEYRGIKAYIDARPEVFAPANHHGENNIIKEYFDTVFGNLYYKDVFNNYKFTHVLVEPSDKVIYILLPYDPDYRMIFEQTDEKGHVICRLYEKNA